MKPLIILFVGSLTMMVAYGSQAQYAIPPQMRSQIAMEQLRNGATDRVSNVVYGLPAPPGEIIGDEYLDTEWNVGNVMMESGDLLQRYKVRYNLKDQMLEIQSIAGVKLLTYKMIKSVVWHDSKTGGTRFFVSAEGYKDEGVPLVGILEVLADGKVPLLKRHTLHVKQPDYVPALDTGSPDTKIYTKGSLYYAKGVDVYEIKGKKSLTPLFGEHAAKVEEYVKMNDLGTKRENDLIPIFEYYNSLLTSSDTP